MTARLARGLRTTPKVSVVIPHFNYGAYLPSAVRSALDQEWIDLELIIVDDKSTDGSTDTVALYLFDAVIAERYEVDFTCRGFKPLHKSIKPTEPSTWVGSPWI